ncbi:RdgB/HAM1 family non-canonical purine NTP pyrophosphatase [Pseudoxanthomonas daejeonensis]|uniref:dITP/XTP pyrophosphatase n=1 Tax=Pseudoxanthomonas daejeonensis TaxID=266062 RepID=A0ABQ6Z824_9GAMM|nr:RdgB/HAM1 family non-canonical purine NTP pyrophosphatase [Pseudoxanthomonas daejeonensis]KAF1695344.1 non-canonical purine NTP pyrophosphatase, RdgB/HAM1 family [Pseudoxanthomonas daejeonensis]UNK58149.1 RdgB/HAM1 family non-canonical purine NTP pyrophosphatase [Pseudoxanthomonas daejeonensis]
MSTRLVLASGNAGKLAELQALLANTGAVLLPQSALGVDDIEETGLTFVENALLKARHAARVTGLPALADDSGLCVDALGGAPGLYSARYAGGHGDSAANIARLMRELEGLNPQWRTAHFYSVIVLLRHAEDPQPLVAEGIWPGLVLDAPRGTGGFGYDPVFFDTEHGLSAAELDPALKNRISHRGRALDQLRIRLPAALAALR